MVRESGSGTAGVLGTAIILAGLAWLVAVLALPHYPMDYANERSHHDAMNQVSSEVAIHMTGASNAVLAPTRDDGLDIFVNRASFESIPFPERGNFVSTVAEFWCGDVSPFLLPSVRFRDIGSGEVMGQEGCALHSAPDSAGSYSGTVHNITADVYGTFHVQMIVPNNNIKGCMQVGLPLVGTGPIVGTLNGNQIQFDFNEAGIRIRFTGTRVGHDIHGKYVVTNSRGQENGDFSLHHESVRVTVPLDTDLNHCPRD
jgi:hypothetical protein